MKLFQMLPVSPKAAIVAISLLVPMAINYDLLFQMFFAAPQSTTKGAIAQVPQSQRPQPSQSALDGLKRSAEEGNVANQLKLAVKYSTGEGVAKDQAEASRWYLRAAEAGDVQAMYEVSLRHRHGYGLAKNTANSNVWRQRAAIGGHPEAAYEVARTYGTIDRRGAVISNEKAGEIGESSKQLVMWLTRASEFGSTVAKHELAMVRLFGISKDGAVKTDYLVPLPSGMRPALQLLTENAEAGSWQSQYALAELYQVGYGDIRPDSTESNKWWQRLDAQEDATIQLSVGRHFLAGDPKRYGVGDKKWMGKDLSYDETNRLAFEWFGRAAAQVNRDAIWELAAMEYNGIGTPKNLARALPLYRKAAELGQVDAMYQLGIAYMNGIGVERDYSSAMRWLARSAAYGDGYGRNPARSRAQNAIGSIYENGYGVTSDLAFAYAWYSLASAGSTEEVSKNLLRVQQKLTPDELVRARSIASASTSAFSRIGSHNKVN
jgi:TPR repeat protein